MEPIDKPTVLQLLDQYAGLFLENFENDPNKVEQGTQTLTKELETIETREKRVVVLIDGDGAIFHPWLIAKGNQGGKDAAGRLTQGIKAHLEPHQFKLHVYVFLNKYGLKKTLESCRHTGAAEKFDDFIVGFNEAIDRFAMIDVGRLKEASDHKIRAHLDDNIFLTETLKVVFGGCHDAGYVVTLNNYITNGYKEKLILLRAHTHIPKAMENLKLQEIKMPELFLPNKLVVLPPMFTHPRPSGSGDLQPQPNREGKGRLD